MLHTENARMHFCEMKCFTATEYKFNTFDHFFNFIKMFGQVRLSKVSLKIN